MRISLLINGRFSSFHFIIKNWAIDNSVTIYSCNEIDHNICLFSNLCIIASLEFRLIDIMDTDFEKKKSIENKTL
jgi:hypothetical protein